MFNDGHKVDIAVVDEPDICLEIKVPSPLTTAYSIGTGKDPPTVGNRIAFGSTEEKYRLMTLGCQARGRADDPPFDATTGHGRVEAVKGHYHDALVVKRNKVVVWLVEASGGIAPQPLARLHRNSRLAASRGARDRTKYGLSRASPRSYLTHHIQRIAFAAVRANAKHARWMISCFKTSVCTGA